MSAFDGLPVGVIMNDHSHPHSQLFTIRLWREEMGQGQVEWRGKLQRVLNGEAFYFRSWPELIERLEQLAENGDRISLADEK